MTVWAAEINNTSTPTTNTTDPHGGPSYAWVAAPVLLLVAVVVVVLCGVWFRWLYTAGERRYWGRVHNEHLRAGSGGGTTTPHHADEGDSCGRRQGRESSEDTDESTDNDRRGLFSWNV